MRLVNTFVMKLMYRILTYVYQIITCLSISISSPVVWSAMRCESLFAVDSAKPLLKNLNIKGSEENTYSLAHTIENFKDLLQKKGITDNKLLYEADYYYTLVNKILNKNAEDTFVAGYAKVKAEFESAVSNKNNRFETLSDHLQSVLYLIKAIKVINGLHLSGKTETEYQYFKKAFLSPDWTTAFASLGKAESIVVHTVTSDRMKDGLVYLAYYAKNMPDQIASRFLDTFSISFFEQAKRVYDDFHTGGMFSGFTFSFKELPKFDAESSVSKALLSELGDATNSFGKENKQKFISSLILYRNSRSIEILDKLNSFEWFKKNTNEDKLKLFMLINFLSLRAESSQLDIQSELLNNSLEIILKGNLPVIMEEMKNAHGAAGRNQIYINNGEEHYHAFNSTFSHLSLHTICHEINHLLSGQKVEASPKYFEEEYRAWYVGFIAEYGRKPNKLEAAERSAFLLTYYKGNMNEVYGYIAESFKTNPEKFFDHLSGLGLDYRGLVNTNYSSFMELIKTASTNEEAPIWGCWNGCLSNKPKSLESNQH